MLKRFLFACLTLCFFIFIPSNVSADNKIIRKKTIRNATITAGNRLTVFASGKTFNTKIMDGGIEDVFVGAVSRDAKVFKGGRLWLAGGKSYGAVVHNGGLMEVREHDNKSSYSTDTKLLSGGRMNVFNHSLSEKITVESKGFLRVYFPGAVISDVTILSGGLVHVWKHGTAQNVYVAPGGVLELREESPVLKGTIRVAGQLKASFDHDPDVSQAKIILDLTKRSTRDDFCIKNIGYLKNVNISVNVAADQKFGYYNLASSVKNWEGILSVNVKRQKRVQLEEGKKVNINGRYYTLIKENDDSFGLSISPTEDVFISEKYSKNLYECLTKSELTQKEKAFVSDAIQEIENSMVGKNIIRLMDGKFDFKFAFKDMREYTWGTYGSGYISLNSKFLTYKTPEERKLNLIYCASVIVHEMTHALHRRHNIRLIDKNPTWIARIQDVKLRELHCKITQTEVATELARKYENLGYFDKPSASRVVDESKTWNKIIVAKMKEGASYDEANRFARKKIAQHLWMNKRYDLVIGSQKICLDMANCWDVSYGASAMRWESPSQGTDKLNEKDAAKILSWLDAGIDIMWMKKNFDYKLKNNLLMQTEGTNVYEGIDRKLTEEYVICHGFTMHRTYHYDGKLISMGYIFRKVPGKKLKKDGTFVVNFPNGRKQAEYTVVGGRLHGFYKEWDSQGKLLFKVPFTKDIFIYPDGEGMITENGKQVQVTFHGDKNYWGQVERKQ